MKVATAGVKLPAVTSGAAAAGTLAAENVAARAAATANKDLLASQLLLTRLREKLIADQEREVLGNLSVARAATLNEAAQIGLARAEKLGVDALTAQFTALNEDTAALLKNAEANAANAAGVERRNVALRGAGTTVLSGLGIRGATLAASAPFLIGAAISTTIGLSLKAAASFEKQLNVLQAASHATADEMRQLSATAKQLGHDLTLPEVSSIDAASALTDLVQAGFSVQDSMKAARGALLLGVAAQVDLRDAVELTAKTLDSFGLGADQAGRVADVLAAAANNAEGNINDFAAGLAQVGPVAKSAGLDLEQTTTLLAVFAKGGLTGAAGGTALRQAIVRLSNPTKDAAALLSNLAVRVRDAQGAFRPQVFTEIAKAAERFGPAFRDSALATLFGARAIKAADIAAREGTKGFNDLSVKISQQGAASDLAEAQTRGLSGRTKELEKSFSSLGTDLGTVFLPVLTHLVDGLAIMVSGLDKALVAVEHFGSTVKNLFGFGSSDLAGPVKELNASLQELGAGTQRAAVTSLASQIEKVAASMPSFLTGSESAHLFATSLDDAAASATKLAPALRHDLDLLSQLAALTGRRPTGEEINLILNNRNLFASLTEVLARGGPEARRVGAEIAKQFALGVTESPAITDSFTQAFRQAVIAAKLGLAADAASSARQVAEALGERLAVKLRLSVSATGADKNLLVAQAKALIDQLQALGPVGAAVGRRIGSAFIHGLSLGITQDQQDAIAAANQAVSDAIKQGQEQVDAAVSSAKSNLGSIAQSLASAVGNVLDARAEAAIRSLDQSKLGREITALQTALDQTNLRSQRAELVLAVGEATDESSRQHALFQLRQFDLQNKLDTDKKKLASEKDTIQKTAEAQKLAVQKNIQAYADAFARGQINVAQFTGKILATIHRAIPDFDTAGKRMAATFAPIQDILTAIIDQAHELTGFTSRVPGGTTQTNIVKIGEVAAQTQVNIENALKSRQRTIAQIMDDNNTILRALAKAWGVDLSPNRNQNKSKPKSSFQAVPDVTKNPLTQAAKVRQ